MSSHYLRRHLVTFGARAPGKSESLYYNLQFWQFFGHFWTSSCLVIFSPETFLGKPTWLVLLCGCLAPFVLPRKAFKNNICSFLAKPKIASKWMERHPYIRSEPDDSFPMISHGHRRYPLAFGVRAPEKSKACIITFNFGCFWDIFGLLRAWSYFLPKHS